MRWRPCLGEGDGTPAPVPMRAPGARWAWSDTHARFAHLTGGVEISGSDGQGIEPIGSSKVRHPTDGSLMVKVGGSVYQSSPSNEPVWVPALLHRRSPRPQRRVREVHRRYRTRSTAALGRRKDPEDRADHPVVYVRWKDATAYAEWAGKALPTSQQWQKAARDPRGNVYPWDDQPTPAKCNVRENGVGDTTAVDCYQSGVSPYGVYDMCGNVWEWYSTFNDATETICDDDTGFRCASQLSHWRSFSAKADTYMHASNCVRELFDDE